jgi:hypothetical protein
VKAHTLSASTVLAQLVLSVISFSSYRLTVLKDTVKDTPLNTSLNKGSPPRAAGRLGCHHEASGR